MIIQCEKCQTRFRLDDSKITDKGVKVRCAKCKHVFTVQKDEPAEEGLNAEVGEFSSFDAPSVQLPSTPEDRNADTESASKPAFSISDFENSEPSSDSFDLGSFETSTFESSEISFETDELERTVSDSKPVAVAEPTSAAGVVDFSNFDFGDSELESSQTAPSSLLPDDFTGLTTEQSLTVSQNIEPQGLDFSDDDMFGAVVESAPDSSNSAITFDFDGDSFAESMDMGSQDVTSKGGALFSLDSPSDVPFSLGEIDFGDELTSVAVQQVNPEDLKPSQEILFAPLAQAQEKSSEDDLKMTFIAEDQTVTGEQQELPPLSIASRRKQSPFLGGLIAVVVVLFITIAGYFGYSSLSSSGESTSSESGKIGVRGIKATFIENDEAGELLVVSGEALNEYSKARAALQVKVTIFDAAGQSIATKAAYGGNPLTTEQLESLPLDKIEAAMANQFGDSLANMEVAPGKAVPFVVVLANLPKGAKDFSVLPAGSTVAAGK